MIVYQPQRASVGFVILCVFYVFRLGQPVVAGLAAFSMLAASDLVDGFIG